MLVVVVAMTVAVVMTVSVATLVHVMVMMVSFGSRDRVAVLVGFQVAVLQEVRYDEHTARSQSLFQAPRSMHHVIEVMECEAYSCQVEVVILRPGEMLRVWVRRGEQVSDNSVDSRGGEACGLGSFIVGRDHIR
jgi:hypothetical protein